MTTTLRLTSRAASRSRFVLHTSGSGHLFVIPCSSCGAQCMFRIGLGLSFCRCIAPHFAALLSDGWFRFHEQVQPGFDRTPNREHDLTANNA